MYSQRKPKIKGNKNVVETTESLAFFNAIALDDDLDINLQAASTEGYTIEADENLIDVLTFKVENQTLVISSYYKITSKKKLNITVNFTQLNRITANAGTIAVENRFSTDFLEIYTFDAGRVAIDVDADVLALTMQGNSKADLKAESDTLNIKLMNKADLKMYGLLQTASLEMQEHTDADIEGFVEDITLKLSGNTKLKARRMEANNVQLSVAENASAEVLVKTAVNLSSMGSAKTYVYGDGKINLQDFLDTSELYRRKN